MSYPTNIFLFFIQTLKICDFTSFFFIFSKSCYDFFLPIVFKFGVNIILVEYPGYGIYNSQDPNAEVISEDAHAVYQYFLNKRKIP